MNIHSILPLLSLPSLSNSRCSFHVDVCFLRLLRSRCASFRGVLSLPPMRLWCATARHVKVSVRLVCLPACLSVASFGRNRSLGSRRRGLTPLVDGEVALCGGVPRTKRRDLGGCMCDESGTEAARAAPPARRKVAGAEPSGELVGMYSCGDGTCRGVAYRWRSPSSVRPCPVHVLCVGRAKSSRETGDFLFGLRLCFRLKTMPQSARCHIESCTRAQIDGVEYIFRLVCCGSRLEYVFRKVFSVQYF